MCFMRKRPSLLENYTDCCHGELQAPHEVVCVQDGVEFFCESNHEYKFTLSIALVGIESVEVAPISNGDEGMLN
jgi:hypothetical protein